MSKAAEAVATAICNHIVMRGQGTGDNLYVNEIASLIDSHPDVLELRARLDDALTSWKHRYSMTLSQKNKFEAAQARWLHSKEQSDD